MSEKGAMTEKTVVLGGMVMLAFATMVLVVLPYFQLKIITPPVASPTSREPLTRAVSAI